MQFWDASALVPLLVRQSATDSLQILRTGDPALLVWWGTLVECDSAIARLKRMGGLDEAGTRRARAHLDELAESWIQVEPSDAIRSSARDLLAKHELTSGDAFQLAAALHGLPSGDHPPGFVCLDQRLRRGAAREGFALLPA
jgi:predicted nucleic acid-binding protein